jgi:HPt (histidine-containing phosphotransfer) domain-containing protein
MNDHLSKPAFAFEVDTDAFDDVLQALGAEQVETLIESVVADIGHLIAHLNVGSGAGALDVVGRAAHHLSGGCRSMGLVGLGAVCARIETGARERVDHKWPAYSAELAQQRDALIHWWSQKQVP